MGIGARPGVASLLGGGDVTQSAVSLSHPAASKSFLPSAALANCEGQLAWEIGELKNDDLDTADPDRGRWCMLGRQG